jgi:pyruvate/2-oxoglutarate dehydrogenase complex dihydrolipoamide dehydrogenase (E3) component
MQGKQIRMAEHSATWDVAIVGGGEAGLAVAAASLAAGRRTVLFERGDTPSPAPIQALLDLAQQRVPQGWASIHDAMQKAASTEDRLAPFLAHGLSVVRTSAHFIAPGCLEAAGRTYPFHHAVIAAGSMPPVPDLHGLAGIPWLTPDTLLALEEAPGHLLVVGGGPEAVELAQAFALLGIRTSLVQDAPNILPGFELELVAQLRDSLRQHGVTLHENTAVLAAEPAARGLALLLEGGARLEGSHLLLAAGRVPRLSPLDLAAARIEASAAGVTVGDDLRSSNQRVWAVGSVAGLAGAVASPGRHAAIVTETMLRGSRSRLLPGAAPRLVRGTPALAQIGMNEAEARAAGHEPQIGRMTPEGGGMAKLVADRHGRLLGAGILAVGAAEVAALLSQAIDRGMTGAELASMPLPRGTLTESLARVAGNLGGAQFLSSPKQRILGALDRWF